jgi:hypothetical protein
VVAAVVEETVVEETVVRVVVMVDGVVVGVTVVIVVELESSQLLHCTGHRSDTEKLGTAVAALHDPLSNAHIVGSARPLHAGPFTCVVCSGVIVTIATVGVVVVAVRVFVVVGTPTMVVNVVVLEVAVVMVMTVAGVLTDVLADGHVLLHRFGQSASTTITVPPPPTSSRPQESLNAWKLQNK